MPSIPTPTDARSGESALIRRLLLALIVVGALGLLAELVLLEHTEDTAQWIPLGVLTLALAAALAVGARPSPLTLRLFRGVMGAAVVAGLVGLYLHYQGNTEFELERAPSLRGLALFWESLRGATPTLAPGALAQLGLLGLVYAFRHPADRRAR